MTIPHPSQSYAIGVGVSSSEIAIPVFSNRNPSTYDVNYLQGKRWINEVANIEFVLTSFTSSTGQIIANWTMFESSTSALNTLTGNTGGPLTSVGGNINIVGPGVAGSGVSTAGNLIVTGSGSTLTVSDTEAQFVTNYISTSASSYTALPTDYFISVNTSGGARAVILPTGGSFQGQIYIVKDQTGQAPTNNITVTASGGTIDTAASYIINGEFASINLMLQGTNYQVF